MIHTLTWQEGGETYTRPWISESEFSAPKSINIADDSLTADHYYREASQGAAFIWRGDFQNAKQLLQAVQRRIDKRNIDKKGVGKKTAGKKQTAMSPRDQFHRYRLTQAHKAQILARLLIEVNRDYSIPLRRAPDVSAAIHEAFDYGHAPAGEKSDSYLISLRELLGFIGAHEWRKNGVYIDELQARIHPYFGVFSPKRGEYLQLIAQAPLPSNAQVAFDVGTGTGVIAALLARRGLKKIIATDTDARALACAQANIRLLNLDSQVEIRQINLFPAERADLIVCNPPWLPARPTSAIERAIYDEDSGMLKAFLSGVAAHLNPGGEAWLVISDLAERLELRGPNDLVDWIRAGGLHVASVLETQPQHTKARDTDDPLYWARSAEVTKLWRLLANR